LEQAGRLAYHPNPAVRREIAVALRDVPLGQCRHTLLVLADGYDGHDRFSLEAFGIACEGKEDAIYPQLLKKFGDSDPIKWSPAMSAFAWRLHPRAALDALLARATSAALSPEARKQAI